MSEFVQTSLDDGVQLVRLCRLEKKNALTAAMYQALAETLQSAADDPQVRVVVFAGGDGVFTAGNDLRDFLEQPPLDGEAPVLRYLHELATTTLPMVAAVDGVAVGIGTTMLLHCDFVYATSRTRFSLPFVDLGVVPEAASSLLLPRLAGYQRAAEWLLLGESFDAEAGQAFGMVNGVCEPDDVLDRAVATARKLAKKPRQALRRSKALLRATDESVPDRIRRESEVFAELLETETAREILNAFLEKRAPDPEKID